MGVAEVTVGRHGSKAEDLAEDDRGVDEANDDSARVDVVEVSY